MTRELIIKEIERRIDEISPFTSVDILDNNLLDGLLNETVEDVMMKLPLHLLPSYGGSTPVVSSSATVLVLALPTDFLRLVKLQLSSWTKPVTQTLPVEHPKYKIQFENKFLKATVNRPLVFLTRTTGTTEANCFGLGVTNTVGSFLYCKKTLAENTPDNILEAVFYMGAFKALVAMEKPDAAKMAMSQFENFVKRNV